MLHQYATLYVSNVLHTIKPNPSLHQNPLVLTDRQNYPGARVIHEWGRQLKHSVNTKEKTAGVLVTWLEESLDEQSAERNLEEALVRGVL